jgi:hypothetical protein
MSVKKFLLDMTASDRMRPKTQSYHGTRISLFARLRPGHSGTQWDTVRRVHYQRR